MESELNQRNLRRQRRAMRIRKKVRGNFEKPRLTFYRSNKHLLAQLIDDEKHETIFGIGTLSKDLQKTPFGKKSKEAAKELGKRVALQAKKLEIPSVVFDRGSYKYHGIIAAFADAARAEGLQF